MRAPAARAGGASHFGGEMPNLCFALTATKLGSGKYHPALTPPLHETAPCHESEHSGNPTSLPSGRGRGQCGFGEVLSKGGDVRRVRLQIAGTTLRSQPSYFKPSDAIEARTSSCTWARHSTFWTGSALAVR